MLEGKRFYFCFIPPSLFDSILNMKHILGNRTMIGAQWESECKILNGQTSAGWPRALILSKH